MTLGIMPVTGLPLPFVSYGGIVDVRGLDRDRAAPVDPGAAADVGVGLDRPGGRGRLPQPRPLQRLRFEVMADTKREIERKYESRATPTRRLPDLTGVAGVAAVVDKGVVELDAIYYDTADQRLAADRDHPAPPHRAARTRAGTSNCRSRPGVRDEIRAPLSDTRPRRPRRPRPLPGPRRRAACPWSGCARRATSATCSTPTGALLAESAPTPSRAERLTGGAGDRRSGPRSRWSSPTAATRLPRRGREDAAARRAAAAPRPLEARPGPGGDRRRETTGPARRRAAAEPGDRRATTSSPYLSAPSATPHRRPRPGRTPGPARLRAPACGSPPAGCAAPSVVPQGPRPRRHRPDRRRAEVAGRASWASTATSEVLTERLRRALDDCPATLLLGPVAARLRIWAERPPRRLARRTARRAGLRRATSPCSTP